MERHDFIVERKLTTLNVFYIPFWAKKRLEDLSGCSVWSLIDLLHTANDKTVVFVNYHATCTPTCLYIFTPFSFCVLFTCV